MPRAGLIVSGVVALLAAAPAANAQTTKCSGNRYLQIDPAAFPSISNERATSLPRLTGGYAPRCLVADSVAGDIQFYWSKHARLPRSVWPHGARWSGRVWRMTYTKRHLKAEPALIYTYAVARRGHETITMDLGSLSGKSSAPRTPGRCQTAVRRD